MQQGVAAGQHVEIVGVAAADDAGQRQAAGADACENEPLALGEARVAQASRPSRSSTCGSTPAL